MNTALNVLSDTGAQTQVQVQVLTIDVSHTKVRPQALTVSGKPQFIRLPTPVTTQRIDCSLAISIYAV